MRGNVAAAALQRIARLLVMIGLGVAAYFALSLLDHAAHADEGLGNADPLASVEKAVADAGKDRAGPSVVRAGKGPISRAVARKTAPLKAAVKERTSPLEERAVPVRKVVEKPVASARKVVDKPVVSVRKVVEKPVRKVVEKPVVSARKVVDRVVSASGVKEQKLLRAGAVRALVQHSAAGRTARAAVAEVVERAPSAASPQALPRPSPKAPPRPAPLAAAESPVSPAVMPTVMAMTPSMPPGVSESQAPRFGCDRTEAAGIQDDQPGLNSEPGTPEPQSPPDPGDQSMGATHLRDSGGGNAPPAGIVPSSWWPDLPAAARSLPADVNTSGRSVRHCGPPS